MSDPVRGIAKVLTRSEYRGEGPMQHCFMHLVVEADGVPATVVEHAELIEGGRWPESGTVLRVAVDRADPRVVRIEWEETARGAAADEGGEGMDERLDRLARLLELRDGGALSDAEFEAQKRRILGR